MQHLDTAGQVDGVIAQPLVEAGQERDLRTDGGRHRLGCDLPGEPLVQDVDLFVSFGQVVRFGGAVAVGIGGVMPHLESDLGHPLDDAAAQRAHLRAEVGNGTLRDVFRQIAGPLQFRHDQQDTHQVAQGRTRRGRIVDLLPHHQFDLGRQFVDRLVTLDDPQSPGTIIAEQGVGGPRQCLGHQRKELRHPKVDGDTFGQAGVHGDPTIIARAARRNSARLSSPSVRTVTGVGDDGELLELEVGDIAGGGGCVGRAPDGRVVFVRHSLPGERVVAQVTSKTTSFMRADAVEIVRASPDRVTPPCPFSGPGRCGGCDFQHIELGAQRALKASRIAEQLLRVAGIERDVEVEPLRHDENGLGWRTRVRLAVDPSGHVGFRRHRSHQLEQVDHCPIACEEVMQTGTFQADWAGVDELEVIVAPDTGESLIAVDTTGAAKGKGTGKGKGAANAKGMPQLPELSARLVVNGRAQQRSGAVHTKVANVTFRVSAGVFWQVHVGAAATLAGAVRSVLDARRGDSVVDLYAGAGLFSVLMARDVGRAGSVLAVERDRRACADAEYNGQGLPQLRVRRASITANLVEKGIGKPGLVVLDPAREGAGKAVMAALHGHAPTLRRVVYVSCDPSSFSRDIRVLLDAGWALTSLRAFDIFPMTEHVELVAALEPPS